METIKRIWASAPWWAWVIMIGGFSAVTIVLLVVDFPSAGKMPYVDVL
ncbi:membrane protein [Gordonia phage Posh]|nr:hypothetical protein BJD65_gp32 [Gordonia phage Guacamole]AMS03523.1 hypothetical protein SEA_GUACAMOLE_32 [Gordonia phage Guacamole]QDM56769.1 hypothetical protein SEA_JASPERJR_32 [Gordonia phage JasperJr]QXN74941.1 membrane protein [Gordonia phage Posh]